MRSTFSRAIGTRSSRRASEARLAAARRGAEVVEPADEEIGAVDGHETLVEVDLPLLGRDDRRAVQRDGLPTRQPLAEEASDHRRIGDATADARRHAVAEAG